MNINQAQQYISAQALTPDQLLSYVGAVSDVQSQLHDDYIIHTNAGQLIMVGYALQDAQNTNNLDATIAKVCALEKPQSITVLAPVRPISAPTNAQSTTPDAYWFVPLPLPPLGVKVRNMLSRAEREVDITSNHGLGAWSSAHQELMLNYIRRDNIEPALASIFQRLNTYILSNDQVQLFSAYLKGSNDLVALAIGDFSAFSTAFYMFAFRHEHSPPGVADALLFRLLQEASARGHSQCNLGLGINDGIRFFKQKWSAKAHLPLIQTSWNIENQKKSWFSRFID